MTKGIVDEENIHAARALIHMRGGEDKVPPEYVAIAHAEPGDEVEMPPRVWEQSGLFSR
jgi:hypothetical protein